jgi:acetamidase/formamidase
MSSFHLGADQRHLAWDNALEPVVTIAPGDEVVVEVVDASGGQIEADDGADAVGRLDFGRVNPCTGPIRVDGATTADHLIVEVLEVVTGSWAWTANIPAFGLLSSDFPDAHLWISQVAGGSVLTPIGVTVPVRPMIGTIGVAKSQTGATPLIVPTEAGGNMDLPQLGAGSTLALPILYAGALLSLGDVHCVQGDGEVCGTGAETSATVRLRVTLGDGNLDAPRFTYADTRAPTSWTCTTGIGPDLFTASMDATRRAIEYLARQLAIAPLDAYLLCSLAGDLRISEIVDAPNWVVSMHLPDWLTTI